MMKKYDINGSTYWDASNIAYLLGYSNCAKAIRTHVDPSNTKLLSRDKDFPDIPDRGRLVITLEGVVQFLNGTTKTVGSALLEKFPELKHYNAICNNQRDEYIALRVVEQINKVHLIKQYSVAGYRIDGYDKENNIAYEIDESHHKYQLEVDYKREQEIKEILGCTFVRIKV